MLSRLTVAVTFIYLATADPQNRTLVEECDEFWSCLKLNMISDLYDIRKHDTYKLANSLELKRVRNVEEDDRYTMEDVKKKSYSQGFLNLMLMKKSLDVFRTHSLYWNVFPGVDVCVFQEDGQEGSRLDAAVERTVTEGRTFGARKRIMMALLPMMYKMGVMTTLLVGLTVLALKGLTIGVILLILGFGNLFGKLSAWKQQAQQPQSWGGPTDIHVHVHMDSHKKAYHGWSDGDDFHTHDSISRSSNWIPLNYDSS